MSTLWFQRILVPLDDSLDVENAIPVLERIARASGGTIELLGVSDIRSNPSGPQDLFSIELKKKGEQDQIDSVSSALQSDSIRVKPVDRLSNITEENILDTAAWTTADLIVLFIEPKDLLLEEAAKEIERNSPLPLLLLHGEKLTQLAGNAKRQLRALVTLDPSESSPPVDTYLVPAMQFVAALSAPAQGALHLFAVEDEDQAWHEAKSRLNDLVIDLSSRAEGSPTLQITSSVVKSRNVAKAIVEEAEGFDLIAMATHGRGGLFHGSVTEHVLDKTQLPIFIVHHP